MRFSSVSDTVSGRFFTTLGEMTDADKAMNPQHSGSDPADMCVRIRINPEIWIRIPDHFWLRLGALAEV